MFLQAAMVGSGLATAGISESAPARTPIRCGILGIDHAHGIDVLKVLKASPDYELVGVCEQGATVRDAFAADPDLRGVSWLDKETLLADDTVKVVAVESGVGRLVPLAADAVAAGKHVHIDKPGGPDLSAFTELRQEAERRRLLFQMGYMFRYNPGFDLIRRALREGWLGDVYAVHGSMCTDLDAAKRARIGKYPGGIMFELGCHLIDMVVLLLGAPKKVTPFIRHDSPAQDALADNAVAVLEYDRAIVTIESAAMEYGAFAGRRFKVAGSNGTIVLNPLEPPTAQITLRQAAAEFKKGPQRIELPDLERHALDFADLAACIRGERSFGYSADHDCAVQKTVLEAAGMPA